MVSFTPEMLFGLPSFSGRVQAEAILLLLLGVETQFLGKSSPQPNWYNDCTSGFGLGMESSCECRKCAGLPVAGGTWNVALMKLYCKILCVAT